MAQVALITGSAGGIGRAIAERLAAIGHHIALHDIDADRCMATATEMSRTGATVRSFVSDISDPAASHDLIETIERDFGPVGVLVNNAGIGGDRGAIDTATPAMVNAMLSVHVAGPIFLTQAAVLGMKQRQQGRIIMMSSTRGVAGAPYGAAYNAAKGAVISLTKGWAKEFAPWGITVNAVAPGYVATRMAMADSAETRTRKLSAVPLQREADVDEIAGAVAYLAGADGGYVTGQVLGINGGLVI